MCNAGWKPLISAHVQLIPTNCIHCEQTGKTKQRKFGEHQVKSWPRSTSTWAMFICEELEIKVMSCLCEIDINCQKEQENKRALSYCHPQSVDHVCTYSSFKSLATG